MVMKIKMELDKIIVFEIQHKHIVVLYYLFSVTLAIGPCYIAGLQGEMAKSWMAMKGLFTLTRTSHSSLKFKSMEVLGDPLDKNREVSFWY